MENAEKMTLHMQAAVTFTLVNTNLVALYKRENGEGSEGQKNVFLVLPTDKKPSGGMTIADMVDDINRLMGDYDPQAAKLDADEVAGAVRDVNEASKKESVQEMNLYSGVNYRDIRVELRQAFLYLKTGEPVEYAFELDVDISSLFPKDMSIFNVGRLSVSVWNTNRSKIMERMELIDFDTYLEEAN